MKTCCSIILIAALAGNGHSAESNAAPTVEQLVPLVRAAAVAQQPALNPETRFQIRPLRVENLWEQMGILVFDVQYLSGDLPFNGYVGYYHKGKVARLCANFGGYGLMSGVVRNRGFVFSCSWGSGRHRSEIRKLVLKEGKPDMVRYGAFMDKDLFVAAGSDGKVEILAGRFNSFNRWEAGKSLGFLQERESGELAIVGQDGGEVKPDLPSQNPATGQNQVPASQPADQPGT